MSLDPLFLLPVAFLIGFAIFEYQVQTRLGVDRIWLQSIGERLSFFFWPRPPGNVVFIRTLRGEPLLFYNAKIVDRRDHVVIETPLGKVISPEKGVKIVPLSAIYVYGLPSPFNVYVSALIGLGATWLSYYYIPLLAGIPFDEIFMLALGVLTMYVYAWHITASSMGVEYHEYEIRGISSGFWHAIPTSDATSPVRYAKLSATPIIIKIGKSVRSALEAAKNALGVDDVSLAAELLALGEAYDIVMKRISSMALHAARIAEQTGATRTLRFAVGRITLGKVALFALFLIIGILIGFALGGGSVVIAPVHNATIAGVAGP